MSSALQGTASAAGAIDRVKYTHDGMIDLVLANPAIRQGEIARHFGYSEPWVSRIFNSDAFLARLAERKKDLVDPSILLTMDEKLKALCDQSLAIVAEKLAVTKSPDLALKALELTSKALGYGARQATTGPVIQQNFVVAMPQKAASAAEWAAKAKNAGVEAGNRATLIADEVIDVQIQSPDLLALMAEAQ